MNLTLIKQMDYHATHRPDAIAVIESCEGSADRLMTWLQLRDAVTRLSFTLRKHLAPGSVVLLPGANDCRTLIAYYACFIADMTVLPIPRSATSHELDEAVRSSGAVAVLGSAIIPDSQHRPQLLHIDDSESCSETTSKNDKFTSHELEKCAGEGLLLLQSSGTTGRPKLVRRDLAALTAVGRNCVSAIGMTQDDRMLAAVPITHSYAIDHAVIAWMFAGFTLELSSRFDAAHIEHLVETNRITLIPATPFMLDALSHGSRAPFRQHCLRHVYSAGSMLPLRVAQAFERTFGIAPGQVYGSTEFGSVTFNNPLLEPFDPLSAGRAMEGVKLRISDPSNQGETEVPNGVEGSLSVSAPSMMNGYIGHNEMTDAHGFLATGDLGRIDEHGRLTITGRSKLLIDVGGLKVNPIEVETVLLSHPSVREAAVVPLTMSDTIQRVKAIVVCDNGERDIESVRAYLRKSLSPHKVPREFEVRLSLPRSATGKLLRGQLFRMPI